MRPRLCALVQRCCRPVVRGANTLMSSASPRNAPARKRASTSFKRVSLNQPFRCEVARDIAEQDGRSADRGRQHGRNAIRCERLRHQQQRCRKADAQQNEPCDRQQAGLGAKCGRIGTSLAHGAKTKRKSRQSRNTPHAQRLRCMRAARSHACAARKTRFPSSDVKAEELYRSVKRPSAERRV